MRTVPAVAAVVLPLIAVAARRLVSGAARELAVSERRAAEEEWLG